METKQLKQAKKLIETVFKTDFKVVLKGQTKKGNIIMCEMFNGVSFQDYIVNFNSKVILKGWFMENGKFKTIEKRQYENN